MATSHDYQLHTFFGPGHCDVCNGFLWGLRKQGYKCQVCEGKLCKTCAKNREIMTAKCPVLEEEQRKLKEMQSQQAPALTKQQSSLGEEDGVDLTEVYDWYRKYVKRDAQGNVVVKDLPREWKRMFRDAGVRPSDLKEPNTAIQLIKAMKQFLKSVEATAPAEEAGEEEEVGGVDVVDVLFRAVALYAFEAQSEHDISFYKGDVVDVVQAPDGGWFVGRAVGVGYTPMQFANSHKITEVGTFPGNYVQKLGPTPSSAPPPPPSCAPAQVNESATSITESTDGVEEEAPEVVQAVVSEQLPTPTQVEEASEVEEEAVEKREEEVSTPPAAAITTTAPTGATPAPPPMPTNGSTPSAPPMRANLLDDLRKSANRTPTPDRRREPKAEKTSGGGGGSSDLLAAIRAGKSLKKASERQEAEMGNLTENQRTDLLSIMRDVVGKRRLVISQDGEGDDDGDDWDDDWDD